MAQSNTQGFGTGSGDEGVVVTPDVLKQEANPLAAIAEYLRQLRDRICLPPAFPRQPFQLAAANAMQKCDFSQATINAITVTVSSGVVNVYLGDLSGLSGTAGPVPDYTVSAGVVPTTAQFAIPPGQYILTVQASGGAANGVLTGQAL